MRTIAELLAGVLALLLIVCAPARADEAAVRSATQALVDAWNRHDVKAWSALLAEDAWVTESHDTYQRFKGRDRAVGLLSYSIENSDLQWDIVRTKLRPDGIVSVVMVQRMSMLPKTDGSYQAVFVSDPSIARWRRDADGVWRVVFFTSHRGWALAEIKKDDDGSGLATTAVPALAASSAPASAATGSEPAVYTRFWGPWAQGCNYCHGRPPVLPSSEVASRIVAVGAATADGAGLRAAMQRPGLGGSMDSILADPALSDEALEAVRRYLVDVRDGAVPGQLVFEAAGERRELVLRNERSSGDAPVTITLLRVAGPFSIDVARSTCRRGTKLAGQSGCRVVLRAAAQAPPAAMGVLELQLAPTPGLEPQRRQTRLRIGG